MNRTLRNPFKFIVCLLSIAITQMGISQVITTGDVNFADGETTNICASGITFYDDGGPAGAYVASPGPNLRFHTIQFIDGAAYGNQIIVGSNLVQLDQAVGEEDTLAIYANASPLVDPVNDFILIDDGAGNLIPNSPDLVGYAVGNSLFDLTNAAVANLTLPLNADAVFAFKEAGNTNNGLQGWNLPISLQENRFQEFEGEVRFTNGGPQPSVISNNGNLILCPDIEYNFVFRIFDFNNLGRYTRAIDVDSILVDFQDGSPVVTIAGADIISMGDPTIPGDFRVDGLTNKTFPNIGPGGYTIEYTVFDKNCGQKTFEQNVGVLTDPTFGYTSSFGLPPYDVCEGDNFSVTVNASPTLIDGDFIEGTTTNRVNWQATIGNPNYTLNANMRTLTLDPATPPGTYQLVAEYVYNQNSDCMFFDTIEVTVMEPGFAGVEAVQVAGNNPNIPFVCESETAYDLMQLLDGDGMLITPGGEWTDAGGNVVPQIIDPSSLGGPGGYTFTYTVFGNGVCPDDSETVRLDVEEEPFAGAIMAVNEIEDECSSVNNLDLFSPKYIGRDGMPDLGGTWVCVNVPGEEDNITLNRFLDLSQLNLGGASQRDFIFRYTVTGRNALNPDDVPCDDAFGIARIRVSLSPIAGQDTTLFICNTEASINLNTLLRDENYQGTGNWSLETTVGGNNAVFTPSVTFRPQQITEDGTYVMAYNLDMPNNGVPPCVADRINVTFNAIVEPDAGDDGVADACNTETAFDLFSGLSRIGNSTNGTWFDPNGNALPDEFADLSAFGDSTVEFKYLVPGNFGETPGRGCMADSAIVTINVDAALEVGMSVEDLIVCVTDAPFALYDTLGGPKDPNGTWTPPIQGNSDFDAVFDPSAVAPGDFNNLMTFTYSHPGNVPGGCADIQSIVSLTVYDLPNAGDDNEQIVDICNIDNTFDLSTLVMGDNGINGTTGLTWFFENFGANPATVDPATGVVDISMLGDNDGEDYTFYYIVESPGCVSDTAELLIKVFKKGNAGNDASFTACTDAPEFLLFDLINQDGMTDIDGQYTDVTPTNGLDGTNNLATFIPQDVEASTLFPTDADTIYYIVAVPNCPEDTAAITAFISLEPNAGISNTPTGADGPLAVCETEEELDLYEGLTGEFQEGGRFSLDIWPPARNADPQFLALRDQVNGALMDPYFMGDLRNNFDILRFAEDFISTHSNDPKQLYSNDLNGPIFRFKYKVSDTTNYPMADFNFGYRCDADSAVVYVRIEADFTNTDNFNFEVVTDPTIAAGLNPRLNTGNLSAVVCENETDFLLNDYFPGLTNIISCVFPPQDEFEVLTLPNGAVYNTGTDYFIDATVLASTFVATDFETITLNVTNECGTATTEAPLNLRVEPFIETRPIDPITLCGNADVINLSDEEFITEYYGQESGNFDLYPVSFNPLGTADDILVTNVNVDPKQATFTVGASNAIYQIDLEVDRIHCPNVVVPIEIRINRAPYAGQDLLNNRVCEGDVVRFNEAIEPLQNDPATGQPLDQGGIITCLNCTPSYTPTPYNSATFNTEGEGGNVFEFRYTVTNPGCEPVVSRYQLVVEERPFPGTPQTQVICNNQTNVFLPNLLSSSSGDLPTAGGTFSGAPELNNSRTGNFLNATTAAPGEYNLTYSVGGKPGDVCPVQTATLTLIINDAPSAGTNGTLEVCLDQGVANLFNGLNGQADTVGGRFVPKNPGAVDPMFLTGPANSLFDFTAFRNAAQSPKPNRAEFLYIVDAVACPSDTAEVEVIILPVPQSGIADTIPLTLCNDISTFDLFTVLGTPIGATGIGDFIPGGTWTAAGAENGQLSGSIINPSSLTGGRVHNFRYSVSTPCGNAFSIVAVRTDAVPNPGMDVNDSICGMGQVINLSQRYPQFSGGTWVDAGGNGGLVGDLFDYTLATGGPSYFLQYEVPSQFGACDPGRADVRIRVAPLSNAGDSVVAAILCKSEGDVDLFDILQGEDAGGDFLAQGVVAANIVGSILRVGNIPDGDYIIRYRVESSPCASDIAIIRLKIGGDEGTGVVSFCGDFDGDGVPNNRDLDVDNDGISNLKESNGLDLFGDHDNDNTLNFQDGDYATLIGSAFDNGVLTLFDPDGDGIINMFDLDSDDDNIFDIREAYPTSAGTYDNDKDGMTDNVNADGINDVANNDVVVDTDGDGLFDFLDLDSDNDGLSDNLENNGMAFDVVNTDAPADNLADYRDTDSDNDGILDSIENLGGSLNEAVDTDSDGTPDFRSLDSDGDGISDEVEAYLDVAGMPEDFDNDGVFNFQDLDSDGDLIADEFEGFDSSLPAGQLPDTDGDGSPDFRDLDSDGDGIPDRLESLATQVGDIPNDADGDDVPDYRELDSDNDFLSDSLEAGIDPLNPLDSDGDGIFDFQSTDADGDGLPDNFEAGASVDSASGFILEPIDSDTNGVFDFQDLDSDGDGILDEVEGFFDCRFPGLPGVDTDGDGIPDYLDLDSDGDGLSDNFEAGLDVGGTPDNPLNSNEACGADFRTLDSDGDGVPDRIEQSLRDQDCDNDGVLNFRDFGDNCKIETFVPEGFSPNGDNVNDLLVIPDIEFYPLAVLRIYNRWGGLIFEAENYRNNWAGTDMNGNKITDGTYFYTLDLGLEQEGQSGFIYVIGEE